MRNASCKICRINHTNTPGFYQSLLCCLKMYTILNPLFLKIKHKQTHNVIPLIASNADVLALAQVRRLAFAYDYDVYDLLLSSKTLKFS